MKIVIKKNCNSQVVQFVEVSVAGIAVEDGCVLGGVGLNRWQQFILGVGCLWYSVSFGKR